MASEDLLKKAVAAFNALSPEQQAEMLEEQRQSWVRGNVGLSRDERGLTSPIIAPVIANELKSCLTAFIEWTKQHPATWLIGTVTKNGKFDRFFDHDTDTAWMGFEAAWNTRPAPAATDTGLVSHCDGKEQEAFETWAKIKRYDMHEHPLHYLFLDPKTNAAREGWNEAIRYCRSQAEELLAAKDAEIAALKKINAMIMGDDENAPRYTTKRLKQEVERVTQVMRGEASDREAHVKTLEADNAAQEARIKELENANIKWMEFYATSNDRAEAIEAKLAAAEKALETLLKLNDSSGPFGGEMYQDRVDRAWNAARAVLGGKP